MLIESICNDSVFQDDDVVSSVISKDYNKQVHIAKPMHGSVTPGGPTFDTIPSVYPKNALEKLSPNQNGQRSSRQTVQSKNKKIDIQREQFSDSKTVEEENEELISILKASGVSFKQNKRKSAVQENISLWQALAAHQLCAPGTYGEHAKKAMNIESSSLNPFEKDLS